MATILIPPGHRPPGGKPEANLGVALFPRPSGEPGEYLTLLRDALAQAGLHSVAASAPTPSWARRGSAEVSVAHLHWLEFIAPSDRTRGLGAAKTSRRAARLLLSLWELRRRGVAIVWTIHNLAPHEPVHPIIERLLQRAVLVIADQAIVHSEHARRRVASQIGHEEKLHVIPHGNYLDVYPAASQASAELRRAYGLAADAFVYLSFGQVRRYKRLPELVKAFGSLPDKRLALLIAGEPRDETEAARMRALAARDKRVLVDLRRIPASEVAGLHSLADAAVFPYEGMFSSGSVLLALSHGLPVVVPADSTGTEIVSPPAMEPVGARGLAAALRAISEGDQRARRDAALATAARYDWAGVGRRTAEVYQSARERLRRSPSIRGLRRP